MGNKCSILIVDDEVTLCMALGQVFEEEGYAVQDAVSAEEALDILKEKDFDVMIFDLKLPGMDGLELCRRVRKIRPEAKIVAMTGFPSLFEMADCRAAGFDQYFTKPLLPESIADAVRELLGCGQCGKPPLP